MRNHSRISKDSKKRCVVSAALEERLPIINKLFEKGSYLRTSRRRIYVYEV